MVPLVGGPTAVSRVEAELWREANAEDGGGCLSTAVTTDDGETVYADRLKLMAWCAPRLSTGSWYIIIHDLTGLNFLLWRVRVITAACEAVQKPLAFATISVLHLLLNSGSVDMCVLAPMCAEIMMPCRSAYFRTRFRSEVGQSEDSTAIDVSGVPGSLLRTLFEAMYSYEVRYGRPCVMTIPATTSCLTTRCSRMEALHL